MVSRFTHKVWLRLFFVLAGRSFSFSSLLFPMFSPFSLIYAQPAAATYYYAYTRPTRTTRSLPISLA